MSNQELDPYATSPNILGLHAEELGLGKIGNYTLIKRIGEGGMGEVFLARHARFVGRQYAIKTILQPERNPELISRFEREIDVLAKLAHPNLLYAVDAGEQDGRLYLVTEFVDGINLTTLCDQYGLIPTADACETVRQMALGLSAAHRVNIVHRDIKPSNVMIDRLGIVKVLDLGLAVMNDRPDRALTGFQTVLGTPEYMSPEQWTESRNVAGSTDIYSLGCTLYFLLTGRPPFSVKDYPSIIKLMNAHLNVKAASVTELRPEIDPDLAQLIDRCLAKDPGDRPKDCDEVVSLVEPFCQTANLALLAATHSVVHTDSTAVKLSDASTDSGQNSDSTKPMEKWSRVRGTEYRWNSPFVIFAFLAVMLSLASVTMAYFGPSTTEAWTRRFDRLQDREVPPGTGFLIEAVRGILFLSCTAAVCLIRFGEPLKKFFSLEWKHKTIWFARILVLLPVSFFVYSEIVRHWSVAGAGTEMATWAAEHSITTTPQLESISYRWYLGYTLSLYILVFGGLIACPVLQFLLSDYRYLQARLEELVHNLGRESKAKAKVALLHKFGIGCRELTIRYVDVTGVLAMGIQYDYWIGSWTMTNDGFATEVIAWVALGLMTSLFFAICHVYSRGIEATSQSIQGQDLDQELAMSRINLLWLVKSALLNRLSGIVCLSLLLVALAALLNRSHVLGNPKPAQASPAQIEMRI